MSRPGALLAVAALLSLAGAGPSAPQHVRTAALPVGTSAPQHVRTSALPIGPSAPQHGRTAALPVGTSAPQHGRTAALPVGPSAPQHVRTAALPVGPSAPQHGRTAALPVGTSAPQHVRTSALTSVPQDPGLRVEDAGVGFLPSQAILNFPWRDRTNPIPPKFIAKYDAWVPFQAVLVNTGPAREGVLTLKPTDNVAGEAISYSRRISLPRDGRKRVSFPVRATYEAMTLSFRDDQAGTVRLDNEWELGIREPRIAPPRTELVLIASEAPITYGHLVAPRRRSDQAPDRVIVVIPPDQLPQTAMEYDVAGLLILDDIAADALTPSQASAIHQWVCRGGAVVMTLLRNAHRIKGTHLEPLLAGPLADVRNVKYMKPFEEATTYLCGFDSETAVQSFEVRDGAEGDPFLLQRRIDRGLAVACGLPLSSKALESWNAGPHLIEAFLKLGRAPRIHLPGGMMAQRIREPIAPALKGSILKSVPPFKAVALLMAGYLFVLIVVPYAVLRPFRRLELAWIGIVVLALAGSGVVYGVGTRYLRHQSVACRVTLVEGGAASGPHVRHNFWCVFSARGGSINLGFEDPPVVPFPFGRQLGLRGAGSPSDPLQAAYDPDVQVRAFPTFAQDSVLLETTDTVSLRGRIGFQIQKSANGMLRGQVVADESLPLRDAWIVDGPRILRVRPGPFEFLAADPSSPMTGGTLLEQKGFEAVTRAIEAGDPGDHKPVLLYRYDGAPSLTNSDIQEEAIHFGIVEPSAWRDEQPALAHWAGVVRLPVEPSDEKNEIEFTFRTRDVPAGHDADYMTLDEDWTNRGCRVELYDRVKGEWVATRAAVKLAPFVARSPFGGLAIKARMISTKGTAAIFRHRENMTEIVVSGTSRIRAVPQ
jgi:hypothetical protein